MREKAALDFAKEVRQKAPGIGLVKLWYMYSREDRGELRIGRDKFVRFMRANELQVRNRNYRPRTTDSTHSFPVYRNLVRELIPSRPNQLWVSDITYWATGLKEDEKKFYYISFITDAYSHEIIGVDLSRTLSLEGPVRALDKALRRLRKEKEPLIHHSDRGCQYASLKYVKKLKKAGIMISMTENGDPKENAIAERVNGIIKVEKYLILSRVGRGGKLSVKFNQEAFNESAKFFGLFVLVSNKAQDCFEALEDYRLRKKTEEAFGIYKEYCDGRKPRVWSGDRLRGRQFVQFIALSYRCWLIGKIREIKEMLSSSLAEKEHKAEKKKAEKLLSWLENRSLAQILDWFDCIEETTVVGKAGEIRWKTESIERDKYFLSLLGMKI